MPNPVAVNPRVLNRQGYLCKPGRDQTRLRGNNNWQGSEKGGKKLFLDEFRNEKNSLPKEKGLTKFGLGVD